MAGVPGCTPPFVLSPYGFGLKGACSVQFRGNFEDPCSNGFGVPCSNPSLVAKCTGIEDPITGEPTESAGWALNLVLRLTTDDPSGGDMTVVDVPAQFAFDSASLGKLKLKAVMNDLFSIDCFGACIAGCTSYQILRVAIADPDGSIFAVMGSSSR
jgi:hypothetical protein